MRTALIVGIATLILACGTAPSEEAQSGQAELHSVSTTDNPSCNGWTCAHAVRPVSDAELFSLLRKFEPAGDNPSIVNVTTLECAEITGSCQPPSCTIRTTCGGGGPLSGDDVAVADGWLLQRRVPQEVASFATRRTATEIACEKQPVTGGVACTFRSNGGGATSSSGGTTH